MLVWYDGDELSIDIKLSLLSLHIAQLIPLLFLSYGLTLKYFFYSKHYVVSYSIDVVTTLSCYSNINNMRQYIA